MKMPAGARGREYLAGRGLDESLERALRRAAE